MSRLRSLERFTGPLSEMRQEELPMNGYWFCHQCEDTVTLPLPDDLQTPPLQACPVCHHVAAEYILPNQPKPTVDSAAAKIWFDKMREAAK